MSYNINTAIAALRAADPRLGRVIAGAPRCTLVQDLPLVTHEVSLFQALLRAIIAQQVSTAAARTIQHRVMGLFVDAPKAGELLTLPDSHLRAAGLSRQKLAAVRDLAVRCEDGTVPSRQQLDSLSDEEIIDRLTCIRGVGRWTVQRLLMFHLQRPDVLPRANFSQTDSALRALRLRACQDPSYPLFLWITSKKA